MSAAVQRLQFEVT